ncbi:hypothetical protein [Microbulbifer sp. S227A]|uniref:hypothetical protein n=1 Tax=Microbulbifer sp. S227A TaxID=3415131 RepID=UPI003C7BF03D
MTNPAIWSAEKWLIPRTQGAQAATSAGKMLHRGDSGLNFPTKNAPFCATL